MLSITICHFTKSGQNLIKLQYDTVGMVAVILSGRFKYIESNSVSLLDYSPPLHFLY